MSAGPGEPTPAAPAFGDPELEILHLLRVKGTLERERLAEAIPAGDAGEALERLEAGGDVITASSHLALNEQGRSRHEELLAAWLEPGAREALGDLYDESFLPLNRRFKRLCAEWQEEQRFELVEEADGIHGELAELLSVAIASAPHLDAYRVRMEATMERFLGGETDALISPIGESYHNIWFELHEDLIATLGRRREDEEA